MITYEIFYNKVYKGSCNLVKETKKGRYVVVDKSSNYLLIDNIRIAPLNEINTVRFLVNEYYQTIEVAIDVPIYPID